MRAEIEHSELSQCVNVINGGSFWANYSSKKTKRSPEQQRQTV